MNKLITLSLFLIFSLGIVSPPSVVADAEDWEIIVPGIEYREFHLAGPNHVFVARLERGNPSVALESSIAQGRLSGGTETVANMAGRYDQTLNYWGGMWGGRNRVVVAINGYYFDPYTGIPYQGQVYSGWYAKRFDDCETGSGGSGFAWNLDRDAFIGASISHPESKQLITYANGATQTFDGVNVSRWTNELILYTPQYDSNTRTDASGAEVLVEMSQPTLVSSEGMTGTVRDLRDGGGSTPISFDHVVLSAHGTAKTTLLANVQVGDVITVSQKIKSYETDCASPATGPNWTNAYASIGGAFFFLRNDVIQTFDDDLGAITRHPRTAIAFSDSYIFFIVVDGRNPSFSIGMTIAELADFTQSTLQATYGIAEDGGGSSTMVVNGVVKNNTFCNNVYCEGKAFFPLVVRPSGGGKARSGSSTDLTPPQHSLSRWTVPVRSPNSVSSGKVAVMEGVERMVANGMMMLVVEPMEQSLTFANGLPLITLETTEIRLGPGTNYASLSSLPADASGVVLAHPLNGVLAKGSYWWKVDFGEVIGWVKEESLATTP